MSQPTKPGALTLQDAAAALRWWSEAGVDIAIDETPHDRFAESAAPAARGAPMTAPIPTLAAPAPRSLGEGYRPAPAPIAAPDDAARSAHEAAAAAGDLDALRAALDAFQ